MPATREALRLTDAYRRALLRLRRQAVLATRNLWRGLTLDDLQASYERFLTGATAVTQGAQRRGVDLTSAYLTAFVLAELGDDTPPAVDDEFPTPYLLPALFTIKLALMQGRSAADALTLGLARVTRAVSVESVAPARRALFRAIRDDERFVGYRRVTSANPCGACLAEASGDIEPPTEELHLHSHCRCTMEPVTTAPERYRRLSGRELFERMSKEEQDRLFTGRGGAEKADLIRKGLPLEALITRERQRTGGEIITETPLASL